MSASPDIVQALIATQLATAKEYRQMAKDFFTKSDELEARAFELVLKLKEMERMEKQREEDLMAEVMKAKVDSKK